MKRILSMLALVVLASSAKSQLAVNGSSTKSFSGYDGEPATITGTLSSGVQGTLESLLAGTATFTYLGNESGNSNLFTFTLGPQTLTEANAIGTSVTGAIGAGALGFSFTDTNTASTFFNGSSALVYVPNVNTSSYGNFQYVIGFNDNGSSDGDFDDFVVGVNVAAAVPEPETYALMLAGLGALGFVSRRRQRRA
ncbi:MAG: PEP-CTERM sorting domain-containing protein [Caldimonas sp.]